MRPLTPQQTRVLDYLSNGYTEPEIGAAMDISINTVKSHKRALFLRLAVHTKIEAVALGVREGYIA